jgi:membrane-associated phospholipid phosphatase
LRTVRTSTRPRRFRSLSRRGRHEPAGAEHAGQPDRHPLSLRFELALVSAAWLAYFGIRALTEGGREAAVAHAHSLLALEQDLGLAWEDEAQELVHDHGWFLTFTNWVYIWGHWPVIAVTAFWLFRRFPPAYRRLRDAMFVSGAIGLTIFALVPVAPPRLAELGLLDTVTTYSTSYRALQPPALTNVYAAMPSLHFGWDLLVGIAIFTQARGWILRSLGIAMPFLMGVAVVATANHFVLDVVAGGVVALIGLAVAMRMAPLPPRAPVASGPPERERSGAGSQPRGSGGGEGGEAG